MPDQPAFDFPAAHRYLSGYCFNTAWALIDKPDRTPAEDEQMLLRAFASFYHWTQRADCTSENRSVSLWQISRIYALLGQPDNARRYAEQCRAESDSPEVPPYCLGYAYEALARAEMLAGNRDKMEDHLAAAINVSTQMTDEETKELLLKDLKTIS
jgi:hypothetical protein